MSLPFKISQALPIAVILLGCFCLPVYADRFSAEVRLSGIRYRVQHELPTRAHPILPDLSRADKTPLPARARFFVDAPLLANEQIIDPGTYQLSLVVDTDGMISIGLNSSHLKKRYLIETKRADFDRPTDGLTISLATHSKSDFKNSRQVDYLHLNIFWGSLFFSCEFTPVVPKHDAKLGWNLNTYSFPIACLGQSKIDLGVLERKSPKGAYRLLKLRLEQKKGVSKTEFKLKLMRKKTKLKFSIFAGLSEGHGSLHVFEEPSEEASKK